MRLFQRLSDAARRVANEAVERLDPVDLIARRRTRGVVPHLTVGIVYRSRNVATVHRLIQRHPSARFVLWALDEIDPGLAKLTVGSGAGTRFELHNRLVSALDERPDGWYVLVDDDVELRRGDLHQVAAIAERIGLNLCQPAHSYRSYISWPSTFRRRLTVARATRWVEIGPVVFFDALARSLVMPLASEGMGWGVEVEWAAHEELKLGIVDAVLLRHLEKPKRTYNADAEQRSAERRSAALGITEADFRRMQLTTQSWSCWTAW